MVDEEVVAGKLEPIERYLHDLRDEHRVDQSTSLDDERTQRVVERLFNTLINACIDLAAHVRATENFGRHPMGDTKRLTS